METAITINHIRLALSSKGLDPLIDEISDTLIYVGQSFELGALPSESKYLITRIMMIGNEFFYQKISDDFDQMWDERAYIFRNTPPPFTVKKSILTDGIDEHIDFGDIYKFDYNQSFSWNIWVKRIDSIAQRCLISKVTFDANAYGIALFYSAGGSIIVNARSPGESRLHTFNKTITQDQWSMVTLTYDGSQNLNGFRIYVDGVIGNIPASAGLTGSWLSGQAFELFRRTNGFYSKGNHYGLSVWDKTLTQTEVTELYNGGTPMNLKGHSAVSNLKGFNKLGDNPFDDATSSTGILKDEIGTNHGTPINMENGDIVEDSP